MTFEQLSEHYKSPHNRWKRRLPTFKEPTYSTAFSNDMDGQIARSFTLSHIKPVIEFIPFRHAIDTVALSEKPKKDPMPRQATIVKLPQKSSPPHYSKQKIAAIAIP